MHKLDVLWHRSSDYHWAFYFPFSQRSESLAMMNITTANIQHSTAATASIYDATVHPTSLKVFQPVNLWKHDSVILISAHSLALYSTDCCT